MLILGIYIVIAKLLYILLEIQCSMKGPNTFRLIDFVRDEIIRGDISPSFVPSNHQVADIFAKAHSKSQYDFLIGKLGIRNPHAPT